MLRLVSCHNIGLLSTPTVVDNLSICHCTFKNFMKGHGLIQCYFPCTVKRFTNKLGLRLAHIVLFVKANNCCTYSDDNCPALAYQKTRELSLNNIIHEEEFGY